MASPNDNDEFPVLVPIPETTSRRPKTRPSFTSRNRSVSLLNPTSSIEGVDYSTVNIGYTGPLQTQRRPVSQMSAPPEPPLFLPPSSSVDVSSDQPERYPSFAALQQKKSDDEFVLKHANLLRSGQLGMCDDPYCTTCPSYYNRKAAQLHTSRVSASGFHTAFYDDARGWAKRFASSARRCVPGIINPHNSLVQGWTLILAISSFVSIFVDPLFLFLLFVQHDNKSIEIDWTGTKILTSVRSITDLIFSINILLQFRLAYLTFESRIVGAGRLVDQPRKFSRIVGAGRLVDHPRKIASHYLRGKFFLDLFIVSPIPQIMILWIIPAHLGIPRKESEKYFIRVVVVFQYILKLCRLLPLIAGQTPTGFIFESAWVIFVINLLTFMLAGHAVGSFWYFFGFERVETCLLNATVDVNACFQESGTSYGIYFKAVNLTQRSHFFTRYCYSLFWGFQQLSTLAGNQIPSYETEEVLFTMGIIGLGLLLFARLIGNMHNFLQSLDRRRMEMMLRLRDVEKWMSNECLPEDIRERVREAERFNWAATRGVNEELLFENMPDDLQRDIKRHLFKFLKKVRIFSLMDESILDAIHERLKQKKYIRSSTVLHRGGLVEKMIFIVRGEMESIGEDVLPLAEGDVCGEELLTWCLARASLNSDGTTIKMPPKRLVSKRNVRCVTNVKAFSLSVADLEDVTNLFSRFIRSHRVQAAIRYEDPYWRLRAAMQIQVTWRYRKKQLQN